VTLGSPAILIDLENLNGMWSMRYCCPEKGLILETVAKKRSLKGRTRGGRRVDTQPLALARICFRIWEESASCPRPRSRIVSVKQTVTRWRLTGTYCMGLCASMTWTQLNYVPHGWSRNDRRCAPFVDTSEYWGGDTYLEHLTEPIEASV